ncbi:MAG: hypothetical protein IPJ14_07305 [Kineosporiaceae bacterium]|nr:hypothetical protein [Kineosporiaceae bacterium]
MGLFSKKPPAALNPITANAMIGDTREDIKHVARVQETILAQLHGGEALKVVIPVRRPVPSLPSQRKSSFTAVYCRAASTGYCRLSNSLSPRYEQQDIVAAVTICAFFVIVGFTGGPLRVPDSKHYWDAGLDIVRFELEEAQVLEQALIALAESA